MTRTLTEEMADELRECEVIAGALDQVAMAQGPALSRAYSRFYKELMDLRDSELREWNEEASCGLHDRRRMLYRCDNASFPYHTKAEDGPCEVFTPNYPVHLCDTCAARLTEAVLAEAHA